MIAIVNPLGLIPLWSQLTDDLGKKERRYLALMLIATSVFILLIFLIFGNSILGFFSIEVPVFQIAGGILLLFTGISMVNGNIFHVESKQSKTKEKHPYHLVKTRFREILVPLAIPMLSGPGSLTTVILFGDRLNSLTDYLVISGILAVILFILLMVFVFSEKIEKRIDPIIFNVLTRLFGILVVAISIQFMMEGLEEIIAGWNSVNVL
jgi:multiple antibiotic resistance protein